MKKAEKIFFVENLAAELAAAKSFVLVNFTGLTVKSQQELKKRLAQVGAKMIVVKNTLLKRAGEAAKIDSQVLSDTILTGQTALILAEGESVAPLQILAKFTKEFDTPKFKVGVIDGKFFDSPSLSQLSTLPPRDILLNQLSGVLISPLSGLVSTLSANTQKLLYLLNEKMKGGDLND